MSGRSASTAPLNPNSKPHSRPTPSDPRARLPLIISRFLGYRPTPGPHEPLPFFPFNQLHRIPLVVEIWIFGFIGAFVSILLIQAVMLQSPLFSGWDSPFIVVSFGASAVLVFGAVEAPFSQPQNLVLGQFVSALVGTCLTKLFMTGDTIYEGRLDIKGVQANTFVNGGLSMATTLLAQQLLGVTHPPGGATGLSAAVEATIIDLGWRYLFVVLVSGLIMLGWALIINNLGRRRYPTYWVKKDGIFALISTTLEKRRARAEENMNRGRGVEEGKR